MKKRRVQAVVLSFLLAAAVWVIWRHWIVVELANRHTVTTVPGYLRRAHTSPFPLASLAPSTPKPPSPSALPASIVAQARAIKDLTPEATDTLHAAEVQREQSMFNLWIMTPITFYGEILDENKKPVAGATVLFTAVDRPYGRSSEYRRTSNAQGEFSIMGVHGIGLQVSVSKEGYYSLPESWGNFGYAMSGGDLKPPRSDPNQRALFFLRKMGETEGLIVQGRDVVVERTGIPVTIDLQNGKTNTVSDVNIQVQTWTQDRARPPGTNPHFDWRCVITVPGGAIQPRTGDAFNFMAPASRYQPSQEISELATVPAWQGRATREYYVKLASGQYARISFTMIPGGGNFFNFKSYLNPTPGHRNLEYNPNQLGQQMNLRSRDEQPQMLGKPLGSR